MIATQWISPLNEDDDMRARYDLLEIDVVETTHRQWRSGEGGGGARHKYYVYVSAAIPGYRSGGDARPVQVAL